MSNRPKKTMNAKPGTGRPRNRGDRKVILAARALLPQARKRVEAILSDESAEARHVLRAAELIFKIAAMVPAPKAVEGGKAIRVEFPEDWRAPAGEEVEEQAS